MALDTSVRRQETKTNAQNSQCSRQYHRSFDLARCSCPPQDIRGLLNRVPPPDQTVCGYARTSPVQTSVHSQCYIVWRLMNSAGMTGFRC
jgi:hypothetical protein